MGRRQTDSEIGRRALFILFLMASISCYMVYLCFSFALKPNSLFSSSSSFDLNEKEKKEKENEEECCKGVEHLELWGDAVKWGSEFKTNSSKDCCFACKELCKGDTGPCLCDSWVYCGDHNACGSRFRECWLKKQKDTLAPDRHDSGDQVMWTSGLVFGKGEGIVGLETEHGILHMKLLPDCAPQSVAIVLELLALRHCAGCHIYRAESRGNYWDFEGNHIEQAPFGPPFALLQGTLGAQGTVLKEIPREFSPAIRRGSVAWVGSGPEFFISLANHDEWKSTYTTFGFILPEDMHIAEKIAMLPTKQDVWNNINVSVLDNPVPLRVERIKRQLRKA
ncbi:hypothetical protein ACFE04_026234 [Oxalis oulophora]